jgi:hypothetical protein
VFAGVTEGLKQSKPAKEVAFEVPGDLLNETGGPKKGRMAARKVNNLLLSGPPSYSQFKNLLERRVRRVVGILFA